MKKKRNKNALWQDFKNDWNTMKGLSAAKKIGFIWDYYKWKIIVISFSIVTVCVFAHMFWEGQKPCRLRVCAVLNNQEDCSFWFHQFTEELTADGAPGSVEVNLDQPFDYDNRYYYMHEIEVMTTISSGRMDFAVCGEDMYSYLLALNACLPLDRGLSEESASLLADSGKLVYDTANLKIDENGNVNEADGIDGYYAVDLSGSEFYDTYNRPKDGEAEEPLYAVIISNTEHLRDCETLLRALIR